MKNTKLVLTFFLLACSWLPTSCDDNPYQQGEILYQNFCANCHMDDGQGLRGVIPPLAGADYVEENGALTACIIRYGMEGEVVVNGVTYNQEMAGIDVLSDFEIANIINYVRHAWGNDYGFVKLQDIQSALDSCATARPPATLR